MILKAFGKLPSAEHAAKFTRSSHFNGEVFSNVEPTSVMGRVISRGRTLWTSYVLQLEDYRLFLGGDSGYDTQFAGETTLACALGKIHSLQSFVGRADGTTRCCCARIEH